jgi:huntingtin-interacting protein 1-related protein
MIHKVIQEGHPIALKEAQANIGWLETLSRGVSGEGMRGKSIRPIYTYVL